MSTHELGPLPEPAQRASAAWNVPAFYTADQMRAYALAEVARAVEAERAKFPNLMPVIQWLENGCDPKEAAKELRFYQAKHGGAR